jgi:hypothetical protein
MRIVELATPEQERLLPLRFPAFLKASRIGNRAAFRVIFAALEQLLARAKVDIVTSQNLNSRKPVI